MKNSIFLILFGVIISISGCKSKKVVSDSMGVLPIDDTELVQILQKNNKDIESVFLRKSLVQFESDEVSHTFRSNIYIKKDVVIRISILAPMGIEVARISMEPDSVTIIDRMGRNVVYTDYDEVKRKFGVEVDFNTFQSLLLNQAFSFFQDKGISLHDYHLGIDNGQYKLSSVKERSNTLFSESNKGILHKIWIQPRSYEINRISFNELEKNMVLDVLYDQFIETSVVQSFPKKMSVTGNKGLKKLSLDITHSDIDINGLDSISFQVSDKYEKIYR